MLGTMEHRYIPLLVLLLLFKIMHITHITFVAFAMSLNDYWQSMCYYDLLCTSVPGPVRNVTVELRQGADDVSAVFSWLPPDEPNGVITLYQVLYAGYNRTQVHIVACVSTSLRSCIIHVTFVAAATAH